MKLKIMPQLPNLNLSLAKKKLKVMKLWKSRKVKKVFKLKKIVNLSSLMLNWTNLLLLLEIKQLVMYRLKTKENTRKPF